MYANKTTTILTSAGALAGIIYGVANEKGFWATAGYALLFSIAGASIGAIVNS